MSSVQESLTSPGEPLPPRTPILEGIVAECEEVTMADFAAPTEPDQEAATVITKPVSPEEPDTIITESVPTPETRHAQLAPGVGGAALFTPADQPQETPVARPGAGEQGGRSGKLF